jgi:hypothetical protein
MVSNGDWCLLKSVSGGSVLLAKVCNIRYITNGVVVVSQFYDLSRIVIALSTKSVSASPLKIDRNSWICFSYLGKEDCGYLINLIKFIDCICRNMDSCKTKNNPKNCFEVYLKKIDKDTIESFKSKLVELIQPIEYM